MSIVLEKRQDSAPPVTGVLAGIARVLVDKRRIVLLLAAIAVIGAAVAGLNVNRHLSSGGFTPAAAESARADQILAQRFGAGEPNVVLVARAGTTTGEPAGQAGRALTQLIAATPGVVYAQSYWTTGDRALESSDGRTALILVKIAGNDDTARATWKQLMPAVTGRHGPLTVQATGTLPVNVALDTQSSKDLSRAEVVAAPLTALILLAAFGSLVAAGLPLLVGIASVAGTFAVLRGLAAITPVSVFAENITTLLGFGLAIDYSLFLVTRYREELARGRGVREAIAAAVSRVGRTVLFSALTVIASLAAMTVFPLYYLRSLAYAGIAVVTLAAAASLLILPPVLAVAGRRINRFDVFAPIRRRLPGSGRDRGVWYRLASAVIRRPAGMGIIVAGLLVTLALPFAHARFGIADDRVLPRGAAAQAAADTVRAEFPGAVTSPVTVVLPGRVTTLRSAEYERALAAVPGAISVAGPFIGPSGGAWFSLVTGADPNSAAAARYVAAVRAVPAPGQALVGGDAATFVDEKTALGGRIGSAG